MFRIDLLPAGHGDCVWIEYGDAERPSRVLIDGGVGSTFKTLAARIQALPEDQRHFELFIITHVDADHIEGAVRMLHDEALGVTFGDVWFNGWRHLGEVEAEETLGPVQGEMVSALLTDRAHQWNAAFGGGTVCVPADGPLLEHALPGGLKLTVLSPGLEQLAAMRKVWDREVRKAGLEPGVAKEALEKLASSKRLHGLTLGSDDLSIKALSASTFEPDGAEANGSSIAVLVEVEGKRVLLTGDAHAPVLAAGIDRHLAATGAEVLLLDAVKLSHHGSASNTDRELLDRLRCSRWLVSTNGSHFDHPDEEAIARVIAYGGRQPELHFNYRTDRTSIWDDPELLREHDYSVFFPTGDEPGISIEL